MRDTFRMFAGYNAWANQRIYDAAATVSDNDYRSDHGAFFGSLHRTLNHILVGDRVWMRRFTGVGEQLAGLDVELYSDFGDLRAAREAEDARIIAYIDGMAEADLRASLTYTPMTNPAAITQPLAPALFHFFNHQTHHRGQAHALLTRITGTAPSLDLIVFQRFSGHGMS